MRRHGSRPWRIVVLVLAVALVPWLAGCTSSSAGPGAPSDGANDRVVVLGDSTAAGLGNAPLAHPTANDTACGRSADAYPVALARLAGREVTSVACSGATIATGILGPQQAGGATVPPQIDAPAVSTASTVIISIGANDVGWTTLLGMCATAQDCDDEAERAYFRQHLALFRAGWQRLVTALHALPQKPRVLVNLYYDPFAGDVGCLTAGAFTRDKLHTMLRRLAVLNRALRAGAAAAGFASTRPDFTGHDLCDPSPYVQGPSDPAPLHPTAAGGRAIARADLRALPH